MKVNIQLNYRSARIVSWIAAALLLVPSIIAVFLYFGWTDAQHPDRDATDEHGQPLYKNDFDPAYLRKLWDYRTDEFSYILVIDFFGCLGLIVSVYSILCLKRIFRHSPGIAKHLLLATYALGTLLPAFEFLQNMGSFTSADHIFTEIAADDDAAIKALEISYRVSQARSLWVFNLIYIFIGFSIICSSALFWTDSQFQDKKHAILGFVVAGVGFITFMVEISMFFDSDLRPFFGVMTLFWGVILFPAWLVYLGWRLGTFTEAINELPLPSSEKAAREAEEEGTEMEENLQV